MEYDDGQQPAKYKMMNIFFKIFISVVLLLGAVFLLRNFLDFESLDGSGIVQEREFEKVVKLAGSTAGINEYRIFSPRLSNGGVLSSNIQGYLATKKGILLHAHFTTFFDQKDSGSICLDWTVNGVGIQCEKDQKQIHPCNAGPEVLQEFRFYTFDVDTMIENQLSVLQKLEETKSSPPANMGGIICRPATKISNETLAAALTCSASDGYCKGSSKK